MHTNSIRNSLIALATITSTTFMVLILGVVNEAGKWDADLATFLLGVFYICGHFQFVNYVTFGLLESISNSSFSLAMLILIFVMLFPLGVLLLYTVKKQRTLLILASILGSFVYILPVIFGVLGVIEWCGP